MDHSPGFLFRSLDVFDPRRTWVLAAAPLPLFALIWVSSALAWVVLGASVLWFWRLARKDAARETCVLLRLDDVLLQDLSVEEDRARARIWVPSGDVARVDSGLARRRPLPAQPGLREVPVLFAGTTGRTVWSENGQILDLDRNELRGALSVVLSGADLRCQLLIAAKPGEKPTPRGVLLTSSNGVLQSWDTKLLAAVPSWV